MGEFDRCSTSQHRLTVNFVISGKFSRCFHIMVTLYQHPARADIFEKSVSFFCEPAKTYYGRVLTVKPPTSLYAEDIANPPLTKLSRRNGSKVLKMKLAKSLSLLLLLVTPTGGITPSNLRGDKERELQDSCNLKVALSCRVREDGILGDPQKCSSLELKPPDPVQLETDCTQTPETVTFLYNGGDCSSTDNAEFLGITCKDSNSVPPTVPGEGSYITVKSATSRSTRATYFGAFVRVGSEFTVHDGGNKLSTGFTVRIYDNASRQRNLLQEVTYGKSLCSEELELFNRFGAVQLVGYGNDYVPPTLFESAQSLAFDVQYDVTFSLMDGAPTNERVSLQNVNVLTTFVGKFDLTDSVKNRIVTPRQPVTVPMPHGVDLSDLDDGNMAAIVQAFKGQGEPCSSAEFIMV